MKKTRGQAFWPILGIVLFLVVWQIAALIMDASWLLPSPWLVLKTLVANARLLFSHSWYTLFEALCGMTISVLLATVIAALMLLSPRLKQMFYPLLLGSQMVPIVVLAPLFLIWFGYGLLPKVLVVILICFFPIVINILAGMQAVDAETLAFYRSMGMNGRQLFRLVRWPMALPYFFSGLRIAATYSIMGAVIGEWLGASAGLGLLLTRAQRSVNLPLTFASIVMIVFWSAVIFGIVKLAEYKLLAWQRRIGEENWGS